MSYIQQYLPIIAKETKKVLGLYNLGSNQTFTGTETSYSLGAGPVAVQLWVPSPSASLIRKVNPTFMASVWTHTDVYNKAYQGFGEFVPLSDVTPVMEIGSSSGLANWVREYLGPVMFGLQESFSVGIANLVPINTIKPSLSGTIHSGQTLTCSTGTWINTPSSYTYEWYRNNENLGVATTTYDLRVEDVGANIYCTVWANNASGISQPVYSNTVMATA